jgi:hypothetical protein
MARNFARAAPGQTIRGVAVCANDSGVLTGTRDFQPDPKLNVSYHLQTTCADKRDGSSIVFVTAEREDSRLQKMRQTTSLGVGPATLTMPSGSAQVLGIVRRETAATHSAVATASTQAAVRAQGTNGAQRTQLTQPAGKQGLTPAVMANNAAAENKKPPATKSAHQAWYHWFVW